MDLTAAIDVFNENNGWIDKILGYQLATLPDFSQNKKLSKAHATFTDDDTFSCFDDDKWHHIAFRGTRHSREAIFAWLVRRSLEANVSTAVKDLRRYIDSSEVKAYQIVFVDGLYYESSDDEADFELNSVSVI